MIRRDQHRLVARDGSLRGERIHRLRARYARHELHRETGDVAVAQRSDLGVARMRLHETDDDCAGFELPDLLDRQRLHAEHDVRLLQYRRGIEPLDVLVARIGEARAHCGAAFHCDARAQRGKFVRDLRNHTDAGFVRRYLAQHTD